MTNYCDNECQRKHKPAHKETCKELQLGLALRRVALILHEAYLTFRENTFDTPIKRIVSQPHMLTVYDGNQAQNVTYFIPFPNNLAQNNRPDKMALLTAWVCNEPYAFLHPLLAKLLKGLTSRLH